MPTGSLKKRALQAKLSDNDAYATTLLAICLDEFGTAIFDWEPESLWMSIAEEYGVELPDVNKDKLQAMLLVYTTDLPFVSVEAFSHICNVLSGSEANFSKWDIVTSEEALWGVYEMMLHVGIDREQGEEPPEFSHEIRRYLGVILKSEGVTDPPDILRVAEFDDDPSIEQWADDPDMFNAAFDLQKTNKAQLMATLSARISELIVELDNIPLRYRDNKRWQEFRDIITSNLPKLIREQGSASMARA